MKEGNLFYPPNDVSFKYSLVLFFTKCVFKVGAFENMKEMKVGIITFHRAENFGAVLQAWALQQFLNSKGYDSWIIDYRCSSIERQYDILNLNSLWERRNFFITIYFQLKRLLTLPSRIKRKYYYKQFRKRFLNTTTIVNSIKDIPVFDAYITGSDQVWNLNITRGYDRFYFLDFDGLRKISYAASMERDSLSILKCNIDTISSALHSFKSISVREEWVANELQQIYDYNIDVCCDPVFLLDADIYRKILIAPTVEKYVLVYHVVESAQASSIAKKIAELKNLELIEFHSKHSLFINCHRHKNICNPLELLGYINNANYIITTSFHGMALSLILNKQFWVVETNYSSRQRNVLHKLGLENRIVNMSNSISFVPIQYKVINSKMKDFIAQSKDFLIKNL